MPKFPSIKFKPKSGIGPATSNVMLNIKDLPVTLYPVSVTSQDITEVISDYDIDLKTIVPEKVKNSLLENNIEYNIVNPHVFITYDKEKGIYKYNLFEPPIDQSTFSLYMQIIEEIERELLSKSVDINIGKVLIDLDIKRKDLGIIGGQKGTLYQLSTSANVALYYLLRNMFGYNVLTSLIADSEVEDISYSGLDLPVYVYHRSFEYVPTNVVFSKNMKILEYDLDGNELSDQIVLRLLSLTGRTISIADPIADGMLPKGDRIAATFRNEVSARGSSFVIRRFADKPITILDLINSGVLSADAAAYLWYAIDMKMSFMVIGVTGAGKTTVLGSLLNLVKESMKIVSIEDIPEIRIANDNWVQLYSRTAYGGTGKEISLMDLLKLSLRYRPDLIVVGEIRGQEAYVLFQAISTGHGGATTFHAYDTASAIKRLMNNPLNIPQEWISMMNIVVNVRRLPVFVGDKVVLRRRAVGVDEIVSPNDYRRVVSWEPRSDVHLIELDSAKILRSRIEEMGRSLDEAKAEIEKRSMYLKLLASAKPVVQSPESYREVKKYIIKYSIRPDESIREVQAMSSLKVAPQLRR
jgi:flagellar protein FlaI